MTTKSRRGTEESPLVKWLLVGVSGLFLAVFLLLPLVNVFAQALAKGWQTYFAALHEPDSVAAIKLTLFVAAICVPLNTLFGVCAAWAVAKFEFRGKSLLITLIDLPFAVSPVVAGLIYVLAFSAHGWLPPEKLQTITEPLSHGVAWLAGLPVLRMFGFIFDPIITWLASPRILFAVPGIALATIFVTFPFVARELIPVMQATGREQEEAALTLGASGWKTFWHVTLPSVKWGLLYGLILCNARAMGEFGAVSVVSGHITGVTNTMPLHVEKLYNEYQGPAAFAVASLLALLALVTLGIKTVFEWKQQWDYRRAERAAVDK